MDQLIISAQRRSETGTGAARKYRREGFVPAVVYGYGQESTALAINARQLQAALRHGASHVVDLQIEGMDRLTDLAALIKNLEREPLTREVLSVDFQWVSMKEEINVLVSVTLTGESPAAKNEGGVLDQVMFDIEIACIPSAVPKTLELDISGLLHIGQSLHVSALTAPEGVRLLTDENETVVTIGRPVSAEDLEVRGDEPEIEVETEMETETEETADEEAAEE